MPTVEIVPISTEEAWPATKGYDIPSSLSTTPPLRLLCQSLISPVYTGKQGITAFFWRRIHCR